MPESYKTQQLDKGENEPSTSKCVSSCLKNPGLFLKIEVKGRNKKVEWGSGGLGYSRQ